MKRLLLLLLALAACQGKRETPVEPAYTALEYTRAGVPAPDHVWSVAEHGTAATALATIVDGHRERLPRATSAVFARMIELGTFDDSLPIDQRLGQHVDRFQAAIELSRLYNKDGAELPSTEWIELMTVALHEAATMSKLVDPYFQSLPADDPQRQVRLDGLAKMRAGWSGMLQGGLLVADNNLVAVRDRVRLLAAIEDAVPALFPLLPAADQAGVRDLATKLVGSPEVRVREPAARIAKLAAAK
ncbi:MAG: hypothetical protein HOV81_10850 [Kofleriaceae bacterium]|nr:hypothetical protein [Kofleriaceae bacterium]